MVGDLIGVMDHSTKFVVVDKTGQIRGFYSTFDPEGIASLLKDVNALRRSQRLGDEPLARSRIPQHNRYDFV